MKRPTNAEQKAIVEQWKRAAPALQQARDEELENTAYDWTTVDALLDIGAKAPRREDEPNGLVEMQKRFMKLARKQGLLNPSSPSTTRRTPPSFRPARVPSHPKPIGSTLIAHSTNTQVFAEAEPRRILVCRGGALGDFIVTMPVLVALRARWPGARLDLLAYPRHAVLAQACGLADEIRSLDDAGVAAWFDESESRLPAAEAAYVARYDLIVCFLHDPDGRVRSKLERARPGRVVCHSPIVQGMHAVDHFGRALMGLGITLTGAAPCLTLPADVVSRGRTRLRSLGERVVLLHPGSGSPSKNWPLSRYLELASRLATGGGGLTPLFLAGEAECPMLGELAQYGAVLSDLAILEVAGVLAASWGYVGNDSGVSHVAAAVGAHGVALFGPTDPAVWGPRGASMTVLRAEPPGMDRLSVASVEEALGARQFRGFSSHTST